MEGAKDAEGGAEGVWGCPYCGGGEGLCGEEGDVEGVRENSQDRGAVGEEPRVGGGGGGGGIWLEKGAEDIVEAGVGRHCGCDLGGLRLAALVSLWFWTLISSRATGIQIWWFLFLFSIALLCGKYWELWQFKVDRFAVVVLARTRTVCLVSHRGFSSDPGCVRCQDYPATAEAQTNAVVMLDYIKQSLQNMFLRVWTMQNSTKLQGEKKKGVGWGRLGAYSGFGISGKIKKKHAAKSIGISTNEWNAYPRGSSVCNVLRAEKAHEVSLLGYPKLLLAI